MKFNVCDVLGDRIFYVHIDSCMFLFEFLVLPGGVILRVRLKARISSPRVVPI